MEIFDSHAHYNSTPLLEDEENLFKQCYEAGVRKVVLASDTVSSGIKALELKKKRPNYYLVTLGIHPGNVLENDLQSLEDLMAVSVFDAVGEIGLDYHYPLTGEEKERQKEFFKAQIKLANKFQKPICLHIRDAIGDALEILNEVKPEYGCEFHCFSGSLETAKILVKHGYLIGVGGVVTFKNAIALKQIVGSIPLTNILIETDAPYLAPVPLRGTVNNSSNLIYVIKEITRIKGVSEEEVASVTYSNAQRFFKI